jgi:DNA-binding winged helix-turn-helix (wHTH) protein
MRFALLGSVEVRDADGDVVDLGGAQPRKILGMLLAADGRVVTTEALIDAVWGESPPATAPGTLQTYISRLRRVLEPGRRPRGVAQVLVTDPRGYRLVVESEAVDAERFETLADAGRNARPPAARPRLPPPCERPRRSGGAPRWPSTATRSGRRARRRGWRSAASPCRSCGWRPTWPWVGSPRWQRRRPRRSAPSRCARAGGRCSPSPSTDRADRVRPCAPSTRPGEPGRRTGPRTG